MSTPATPNTDALMQLWTRAGLPSELGLHAADQWIADRLKVHPRTVRTWRLKGTMPHQAALALHGLAEANAKNRGSLK